MADGMISMEVRLAVGAHAVLQDSAGVSVTVLCRQLGISRQTYYQYAERMAREGLDGLIPKSRAPKTSPTATPAFVRQVIVDKHDQLLDEGWDAGARSVHDWLVLDGVPVPSARTCHKVLAAAGRTVPTPAKRPKNSYRRFEAMHPNGVWQLDGHQTQLASGTAVVLRFQDDHSRAIMGSRAAPSESGADTWACLVTAMNTHGKPAFVQCDNSSAFTGRLIKGGGYVEFEARLHRIGVGMINSHPGRPRTNGKKEREWQTLEQWLAARPRAEDLHQLQRLLDTYDQVFTHQRPHQGIDGKTPATRYAESEKATPDPASLRTRQFLHTITLPASGYFDLPGARVAFGKDWGGATIEYLIDLDHAVLFHGDQLLAHIRLDPNQRIDHSTSRAYHRVGKA
ncbi:MAG TPA: integrase core domain-containing protein [Phycicoccus sp.]|nr:integrase core domain-containing protein [Phycicoccus sp.]